MSPPGIRPGSSPSMRITYGTRTISSEAAATRLSTRSAREPVRRAISRAATGMARKATSAA
ncbi:hypothetical protein Aph01nite_65800 [Acrocarpospora phusangensis]|uniref:Uncharacterized protein n=1 Tax=Acrocarpospora phusangensis TaxID=1070424 RepID=A0A919QL27_9ACTN|nr:hypothetical protein Aph01nite_65800 [Acrocarpospora phusangensis]